MSLITSSSINRSIQAGLEWSTGDKKSKETTSQVYVFGKLQKKDLLKHLKPQLYDWQWQELERSQFTKTQIFHGEQGPLSYLPVFSTEEKCYTPEQLHSSEWGRARDAMGSLAPQFSSQRPIQLIFVACTKMQIKGALLGLGLARYSFKAKHEEKLKLNLSFVDAKLSSKELQAVRAEYEAVNLARHLVNLPACQLNPTAYARFLQNYFKSLKAKVWGPAELKKENMGLIVGVGKGAKNGPYLVQLSHRGAAKTKKPIAFIGKGITFDSGGLDVKPPSAMRLMKKDMGGSASVVGVAYYLMKTKAKTNCDFYLGIAENTISHEAFRPGDILTSRKGLTVEIHNTDAEGRLVLADALSFAATQKQKPQALIDVATLTGAVKVGLGAYLPGLFSNNSTLQAKLLKSAQTKGEPLWPMPLDPQQESALHSYIADMTNCRDGFGGAVSAALFLERFTEGLPWAHFDIYAWSDGNRGALREKGGSGQAVQSLLRYLGVSS